MSPGRRRSTAMFICWMVARSTSFGSGVRMNVFGGSFTSAGAEVRDGTGGMPLPSGKDVYCSSVWLKKMS